MKLKLAHKIFKGHLPRFIKPFSNVNFQGNLNSTVVLNLTYLAARINFMNVQINMHLCKIQHLENYLRWYGTLININVD